MARNTLTESYHYPYEGGDGFLVGSLSDSPLEEMGFSASEIQYLKTVRTEE